MTWKQNGHPIHSPYLALHIYFSACHLWTMTKTLSVHKRHRHDTKSVNSKIMICSRSQHEFQKKLYLEKILTRKRNHDKWRQPSGNWQCLNYAWKKDALFENFHHAKKKQANMLCKKRMQTSMEKVKKYAELGMPRKYWNKLLMSNAVHF